MEKKVKLVDKFFEKITLICLSIISTLINAETIGKSQQMPATYNNESKCLSFPHRVEPSVLKKLKNSIQNLLKKKFTFFSCQFLPQKV